MVATQGRITDERLEWFAERFNGIVGNIEKVIQGKREVIELIVLALLSQGHVLIEDVPGVGKTLIAKSLARSLDCTFHRIQFTPDLLPSDVTGVSVWDRDRHEFAFRPGPIFANVVLADEINRTPPKTQAALLEAMQERSVTAAGETYRLPPPFFVLATQNPIEQEGTYPLPEAQLDRFMLELPIYYPSKEEEEEGAMRTTGEEEPEVKPVLAATELIEIQKLVRRVPAPPSLVSFAVRLARSTRPSPEASPVSSRYVAWGAGPRASQYLVLGAKARAASRGAPIPSYEDVRAVAPAVLAHRLVLNFEAEADGRTTRDVIRELLEESEGWT